MHTPEPWIYRDGRVYGPLEEGPHTEHDIGLMSPRQRVVAAVYGSDDNARLIAAAPELLEALQGMLDAFSGERAIYGDGAEEAIKTAQHAISKATGKEIR